MMNAYYIKFKHGGFSYIHADRVEETKRDYVFKKDDPISGEIIIVERWPKEDVKSIEENPTFGMGI